MLHDHFGADCLLSPNDQEALATLLEAILTQASGATAGWLDSDVWDAASALAIRLLDPRTGHDPCNGYRWMRDLRDGLALRGMSSTQWAEAVPVALAEIDRLRQAEDKLAALRTEVRRIADYLDPRPG